MVSLSLYTFINPATCNYCLRVVYEPKMRSMAHSVYFAYIISFRTLPCCYSSYRKYYCIFSTWQLGNIIIISIISYRIKLPSLRYVIWTKCTLEWFSMSLRSRANDAAALEAICSSNHEIEQCSPRIMFKGAKYEPSRISSFPHYFVRFFCGVSSF